MRFHLSIPVRLVVIALLIVVGCGGGSSAELTIPDSPEGSVRVVLDGVVQHHPEIVWDALPASYQQDVSNLSRNFADTVDPAVFDRAVAVVRKGVVVLQSKKDLIMESATFERSQVDAETAEIFWEAAVHVLDALLASDVADLVTLRELDVANFLATTGGSIMDHASKLPAENEEMANFSQRLKALEGAGVELTSREGDLAVVLLSVPGEDPAQLRLVRIEDRWIPEILAAQWPQAVTEAEARIEYLGSEESAQLRVQALFGIGVVEGFIDQIDQMETTEEFDDLVGGVLGNIIATQGGPDTTTEG